MYKMNEFESRPITVKEYLEARDLMVAARDIVWKYYELTNFESDKSGKLIDAYNLVMTV